jgi:hypothetical protein
MTFTQKPFTALNPVMEKLGCYADDKWRDYDVDDDRTLKSKSNKFTTFPDLISFMQPKYS